ncbi:unnamed protein product [Paramecium octaurelia]|uniref:VIT domain-containing protein n=1 Tax=Paramecium octaurelia TaxID=43137 RepID=A0A8S1YJS8_PAROT|nr:unnamed protein product [Paramecium octaurelia]
MNLRFVKILRILIRAKKITATKMLICSFVMKYQKRLDTSKIFCKVPSQDFTWILYCRIRKPVELEYVFSINENAAITKMVVELGETKVYSVIKEMEKAKQEYQEGLAQRQTMASSGQDMNFPQIKKVKIGQIEPNKQLKINFEYILYFFHLMKLIYLVPRYTNNDALQYQKYCANIHSKIQ